MLFIFGCRQTGECASAQWSSTIARSLRLLSFLLIEFYGWSISPFVTLQLGFDYATNMGRLLSIMAVLQSSVMVDVSELWPCCHRGLPLPDM